MKALLFYIVVPLIYLFSLLPFPVLYFLSDGTFLILYRLLKYRRKVVRENLERSFPQKSQAEIQDIEKAFYHHLCDLIFEVLKGFTISKSALIKRCSNENPDVIQKFYQTGKSVLCVMGHTGNWEWGGCSYQLQNPYRLLAIYRPLRNPHFNRLFKNLRSRFGSIPVAMREVPRVISEHKNKQMALIFISDQTPPPENAIWVTFLNQDTAVFPGIEKVARKYNLPVIYYSIKKIRRGYYQIKSEVLIEEPVKLPEGKLTEIHVKKLEQDILAQPFNWLWSHRRWKYKRSS